MSAENTTGGDYAAMRRYHLRMALSGNLYGYVEGQFERWFPSSGEDCGAWDEFGKYFSGLDEETKNDTFFRDGKFKFKREDRYASLFTKSFNLVVKFMVVRKIRMANRLHAVDSKNSPKDDGDGDGDGATKPDITIVAVNARDIVAEPFAASTQGTANASDTDDDPLADSIEGTAEELSKRWCNGVCFLEVKVQPNILNDNVRQVLGYGYSVSQ